MMNLYCFHSPVQSSVGFQEAFWSVKDGKCVRIEASETDQQVRQALLDGAADALCMDTGRGTRSLMMRNIFVRRGEQSGWHLNFALETDGESYAEWADLAAAFVAEYAGFTQSFAQLFSVRYEEGEHYELDGEGFLELIRTAGGALERLCQALPQEGVSASHKVLHSFAATLQKPFEPEQAKLLLLVPSVSINYFMQHSCLKALSGPAFCIGSDQWAALLAHREPVEEPAVEPDQAAGQEEQRARLTLEVRRGATTVAVALAAAAGCALFLCGLHYAVCYSKKKRQER